MFLLNKFRLQDYSPWSYNIRYNNLHGVFQTLADNMFRPFIGIFALALGAGNFQVAMLSSLPALISALTMLPGTWLISRYLHKKKLTAVLFFINRTFFLVIAAVPFLPYTYRAVALVIAIGVMNLPGAISIVAWQSLMGVIIPVGLRSEAFASRNQIMGLVSLAPTLVAGLLLDKIPSPLGYQIMFTVAFLLAMVEIYVFLHLREDEYEQIDLKEGKEQRCNIRGLVAEKAFFIYMLSSLVFYFGWQMAWPLFTIYEVINLGANNTWIAIISAITTLVSVFSYHWWGKYAVKKGNYKALGVATFGMALSPFMMALSPNLWVLSFFTLFMGYFTAGTVLILFNTMLDTAPSRIRTSCVAYYNTVINISASIAPFVGTVILDRSNIYVALIVAGILRGLGCGAFFLVRVKAEHL